MTSKAQNALRLAAWVRANHPQIFKQLLASAKQQKGLSGLGCNCPPKGRRSSFGTFGDTGLTNFAPDLQSNVGFTGAMTGLTSSLSNEFNSALGTGLTIPVQGGIASPASAVPLPTGATANPFASPTLTPDVQLQNVTAAITAPAGSTSPAGNTSSGGFWSSLASVAGTGLSAVGSFLTSGGGLAALATVGGAYFAVKTAQANSATAQANAQAQAAVLQAQVNRTAAGQSPVPISYELGANGETIPVNALTGQPITNSDLSVSSLSSWLPWAILGGLALYIIL